MEMICPKAATCDLDCVEKQPHEKDLACDVACDRGEKCVPFGGAKKDESVRAVQR